MVVSIVKLKRMKPSNTGFTLLLLFSSAFKDRTLRAYFTPSGVKTIAESVAVVVVVVVVVGSLSAISFCLHTECCRRQVDTWMAEGCCAIATSVT